MLGCSGVEGQEPLLNRATIAFLGFRMAVDELGITVNDVKESFAALAVDLHSLETRRRVWFWRGFIGDDRKTAIRVLVRRGRWWYIGRAAGELVAGVRP